jgi:hypothetical protein
MKLINEGGREGAYRFGRALTSYTKQLNTVRKVSKFGEKIADERRMDTNPVNAKLVYRFCGRVKR